MLSDHYITYCDDKPALQAWLAANIDKYPGNIFQAFTGVHKDNQGTEFVFVRFDRFDTLKSDDETKTLSFVKVRDLEQRQILLESPLQILAAGDCRDPENCPYKKIFENPEALAKYREVISEDRQEEEFGGDFRFCVI